MLLWSMKSRNPVMLIISNHLWEWFWVWTAQGSLTEYFNSQVKKCPLVPHSFAFLCFLNVVICISCCSYICQVPGKCLIKWYGFSAVLVDECIKEWLKAQWLFEVLCDGVASELHTRPWAIRLAGTVTAACLIGWFRMGKCRVVYRWNTVGNVPLNNLHFVPALTVYTLKNKGFKWGSKS